MGARSRDTLTFDLLSGPVVNAGGTCLLRGWSGLRYAVVADP